MQYNSAVAAAAGNDKFDLAIKNLKLVNVYTKEVYPAVIGVKAGLIAHIGGPDEQLDAAVTHDAGGRCAAPGLIDTHVHIESSMMTGPNMALTIIPHGTTTIACDPHEMTNVAGLAGFRYMVDSCQGLPLSVKFMVPSCVPSAVGVETAGAEITANDVATMLAMPDVVGVAEVMDYVGVVNLAPRITSILEVARSRGAMIEGHAPTLSGRSLSAYIAAGVRSDHECATKDEAIEKLRLGMTVHLRESSATKNIKELAPAVKKLKYPPNTTLCTDDREASDLLAEGHIDHVLRRAVEEGIPAVEAIRMATLNAANWLRLYDRGALSPGLRADITFFDDLESLTVNEVFFGGQLVAKDGKMAVSLPPRQNAFEAQNTVRLAPPTTRDFAYGFVGERATLNIIAVDDENPVLTHLEQKEFNMKDGFVDLSDHPDCVLLAVFERYGKTGKHGLCVLRNVGLTNGAIASTVAHDCHNLIVMGRTPEDMALAASALVMGGGGLCCVENGEMKAHVALPVGGILSPLPAAQLAPHIESFKKEVTRLGLRGEPVLEISCFPLAVIPEVRLTDMGLVDVATQQMLPIFV